MERLEYIEDDVMLSAENNRQYEDDEKERIELLNQLPDDISEILEINRSSIKEIKKVRDMLEELPYSLRKRWLEKFLESKDIEDVRTEEVISDLSNLLEKRSKEGYKVIKGYHVTKVDLPVGSYIIPGKDGVIYYSEDITNLYGRYGGGWLYIVEGRSNDDVVDEELGWRATGKKMKIIGKIPLNKETQKKMGWNFAKCEYH